MVAIISRRLNSSLAEVKRADMLELVTNKQAQKTINIKYCGRDDMQYQSARQML